MPPQYDTTDQMLMVLTVDQALDKLPSIYADVMRLVRDGLTHAQIAERLGIPVGTVKSRSAMVLFQMLADDSTILQAATGKAAVRLRMGRRDGGRCPEKSRSGSRDMQEPVTSDEP